MPDLTEELRALESHSYVVTEAGNFISAHDQRPLHKMVDHLIATLTPRIRSRSNGGELAPAPVSIETNPKIRTLFEVYLGYAYGIKGAADSDAQYTEAGDRLFGLAKRHAANHNFLFGEIQRLILKGHVHYFRGSMNHILAMGSASEEVRKARNHYAEAETFARIKPQWASPELSALFGLAKTYAILGERQKMGAILALLDAKLKQNGLFHLHRQSLMLSIDALKREAEQNDGGSFVPKAPATVLDLIQSDVLDPIVEGRLIAPALS